MMKPNYWCTWNTQNLLAKEQAKDETDVSVFEGDQGACLARDCLDTETLFGDRGLAWQFAECRGDLYLMLDDGWDVPYNTNSGSQRSLFASLELNEARFPEFLGSPAQRLKAMNLKVKQSGWRGLGLWVACQSSGEPHENAWEWQRHLDYWSERLGWCRYAEIEYLKVDWGYYASDIQFRRMLNELRDKISPGTVIEHAYPCSPFNDVLKSGRYPQSDLREKFLERACFSDIFRIYDTMPQLSIASTIDRCATLLADLPQDSRCLLNAEDELYIAAGLGLAFGAMRNEIVDVLNVREDPRRSNKRCGEISSVLAFYRLAQPFANYEGDDHTIITSEAVLCDSWRYSKGDTWCSEVLGRRVEQAAPAVCSRNMPLPQVEADSSGELPFVVCARYPEGATAISLLPRTDAEAKVFFPLASLRVQLEDLAAPVGIFGKFDTLVLLCPEITRQMLVTASLLPCVDEVDITPLINVEDGSVTLTGTALAALKAGPESENGEGYVLFFRRAR